MSQPLPLTELDEEARQQALARYQLLEPFLNGQTSLTAIAETYKLTLRTLQRWVRRYRQWGVAGLTRKKRSDAGQRRIPIELQQLIESLALQKSRPSAAAIHRQLIPVANENRWSIPSYDTVYETVRAIDKALLTLAHEGTYSYRQQYDLLYRREASAANEIWQADHTCLDIWLVTETKKTARPWLTVIEDDYSRAVAGYYLSFDNPSTINTCLALHQAIWRKADARWTICGIPQIFYTDHGSDFTSRHLEQVAADLKMQLIFSTVGMPRGRGRVERFFRTLNQLFLHTLPGFIVNNDGKPTSRPQLTLPAFQTRFHEFLLDTYLQRPQRDLKNTPKTRWEEGGFLPQMPTSLEQLDLLLLTEVKTRRVRRDGIHFHNMRYIDTNLAAYIGEDVVIRYDPRDMAEIRVFYQGKFVCRALCQELAGREVSLKEIIRARQQRKNELQKTLRAHEQLRKQFIEGQLEEKPPNQTPKPKLKRYRNE